MLHWAKKKCFICAAYNVECAHLSFLQTARILKFAVIVSRLDVGNICAAIRRVSASLWFLAINERIEEDPSQEIALVKVSSGKFFITGAFFVIWFHLSFV